MVKAENSQGYDDIINIAYPIPSKRPLMPRSKRVAQFSPFAALAGYDDAIIEAARITEGRKELSDDEKALLDAKLKIISNMCGTNTVFHFVYFVPDECKDGGEYVPYSGSIMQLDLERNIILLNDHTVIEIEQIVQIESDIFEQYEI